MKEYEKRPQQDLSWQPQQKKQDSSNWGSVEQEETGFSASRKFSTTNLRELYKHIGKKHSQATEKVPSNQQSAESDTEQADSIKVSEKLTQEAGGESGTVQEAKAPQQEQVLSSDGNSITQSQDIEKMSAPSILNLEESTPTVATRDFAQPKTLGKQENYNPKNIINQTQDLVTEDKKLLIAQSSDVNFLPEVLSGPASFYRITVPFVKNSGVGVNLPSDKPLYILTLIQIFGFNQNEAKDLVSKNSGNIGISVQAPIIHQQTIVVIEPKYYLYYTDLIAQRRNLQQYNASLQETNEQKQRQIQWQNYYISFLKTLNRNQIKQLENLFNNLATEEKNRIQQQAEKLREQIGGSTSDIQLNQALKFALFSAEQKYQVSVADIISGKKEVRQNYLEQLDELTPDQINELNNLFIQLDNKHKKLVENKVKEQLQLIGGSAGDVKLTEILKYFVIKDLYPNNVGDIISGIKQERQACLNQFNALTKEQNNLINDLFNRLSGSQKKSINEQSQVVYGKLANSNLDSQLFEAIQFNIIYKLFPLNVNKILNGQVTNTPQQSNIASEFQPLNTDNPVISTDELPYDINPELLPNNTLTPAEPEQNISVGTAASSSLPKEPNPKSGIGVATTASTIAGSNQIETETTQYPVGKIPLNTINVEPQVTNSKPSTPEEIYVSNFIQLLKANAKARLKENSSRLQEEIKKYERANPEGEKHLQRLHQLIEKDQDLALKEQQLEIQVPLKLEELDLQASFLGGLNASPEKQQEQQQQLNLIAQQRQQLKKLPEEIKQVRKVLRAGYPALAVIKSTEISASTDNDELHLKIVQGFQSIQNGIADVAARLDKNDIPLQKLGPVLSESLVQTGINPQKRDKDPKSKAILDYLEREQRKDFTIQLAGTLTNIVLGVGAFFATGGVAIFLGVAAALVGLGTAAYELEQADDLYAAARTGEAGGKPVVDDPEEAHFNLIMSWVNVLLAGLDLGVAVKGGTALLEATSKTRRMIKMHDADVLSLLEPNEIAEFKQAIQSLGTTNINKRRELPRELEQLKLKLTQRLGKEEGEKVFEQASSVFQRVELPPAKVSELNGFKDVLPNNLRDTVPIQVDPNLTGKTVKVHYLKVDGQVSEFYIQVAPGVKASDIREHVPSITLMRRYAGLDGRVRVLRSKLAFNKEPRVGTKAWEAKFEIEKFERMINTRVQKLALDTSHGQARIDGLIEIEDLTEELIKYERILDDVDSFNSPGIGYVASEITPKPSATSSKLEPITNPRIIGELSPGEIRTPEEVQIARQYFKNRKAEAIRRWEQRSGETWPTDPATGQPARASHPRALADGGDPMFVEPAFGDSNTEHMIPDSLTGETDQQRYGRREGNKPRGGKREPITNPRIIGELSPGEIRTPEEVQIARQYFKNRKAEAIRRWEQRSGETWPTDPATGQPARASHPRALADGGDPMFVEPAFGDSNTEHMIPDSRTGETDQQRYGRRRRKNTSE
ncbi:MAG: hypothetical protein V7L21_07045 [Nostoc sp.]|uniref:hypothetical protein n=1 Tax=Nostoc sp. TaxID=1180 RepID=UPI002FFC2BB2